MPQVPRWGPNPLLPWAPDRHRTVRHRTYRVIVDRIPLDDATALAKISLWLTELRVSGHNSLLPHSIARFLDARMNPPGNRRPKAQRLRPRRPRRFCGLVLVRDKSARRWVGVRAWTRAAMWPPCMITCKPAEHVGSFAPAGTPYAGQNCATFASPCTPTRTSPRLPKPGIRDWPCPEAIAVSGPRGKIQAEAHTFGRGEFTGRRRTTASGRC